MFKFTVNGAGWRKSFTGASMPEAIEIAFPGEGETLEREPGTERGTITLMRAGRKVATLTTDGTA